MSLGLRAFEGLFPGRSPPRIFVKYSGRFKPYNANVRRYSGVLEFRLSDSWRGVLPEVQVGLMQYLLGKLYNVVVDTSEFRMYESFMKHVSRLSPSQESDPLLVELFEELNEEYFNGLLDRPTLVWGSDSFSVLGYFHFPSNKVVISGVLRERRDLARYVLYHELLHKKHGFVSDGLRTFYHTRKFRADEARYTPDLESELRRFLKRKKRRFFFF